MFKCFLLKMRTTYFQVTWLGIKAGRLVNFRLIRERTRKGEREKQLLGEERRGERERERERERGGKPIKGNKKRPN